MLSSPLRSLPWAGFSLLSRRRMQSKAAAAAGASLRERVMEDSSDDCSRAESQRQEPLFPSGPVKIWRQFLSSPFEMCVCGWLEKKRPPVARTWPKLVIQLIMKEAGRQAISRMKFHTSDIYILGLCKLHLIVH